MSVEAQSHIDNGICNVVDRSTKITLTVIEFGVLLVTLIFFLKGIKFICDNIREIPKYIYIVYVVTCISWILCFILGILYVILGSTKYCDSKMLIYISNISKILYYISINNEYLLYVNRLKLVFTNTKEAISSFAFGVLIFVYVFQIIGCLIWLVLIIINPKEIYNINSIIISSFLYLISSVLIIILFITKAHHFASQPNLLENHKTTILNMAVKYLVCVPTTLVTMIIISILQTTMYTKRIKEDNYTALNRLLYIFTFMYILDGCLHISFLHLQLRFMRQCYYSLCNPCRMEINSIFNKKISDIELTTEYNTTTNDNNDKNSISSTDINTVTPKHLEPTKTGTNEPSNSFVPENTSQFDTYTDSIHQMQTQGLFLFDCPCPAAFCSFII